MHFSYRPSKSICLGVHATLTWAGAGASRDQDETMPTISLSVGLADSGEEYSGVSRDGALLSIRRPT